MRSQRAKEGVSKIKSNPVFKCIVPDCKREPNGPRGCCASCYRTARLLVVTSQTTWDELEKLGLIRKSHELPRNPLLVAYQKAKERKVVKASRGRGK